MYASIIDRLEGEITLVPLHQLNQNIYSFNSLPDDKILDWTKLKQTADDILNCI